MDTIKRGFSRPTRSRPVFGIVLASIVVARLVGPWPVVDLDSLRSLQPWIGLTLLGLPFSSFFRRRRDPRKDPNRSRSEDRGRDELKQYRFPADDEVEGEGEGSLAADNSKDLPLARAHESVSDAERSSAQAREKQLGLSELPTLPQVFVGRDVEIDAILPQILPGSVFAIHGAAGIGKTTLVSAAVRALADSGELLARFPGGLVYHDFGDEAVCSVDIVLEKLVRRREVSLRKGLEEAARQAMKSAPILCVLEDVEHADDLNRLFEALAPACIVLTSVEPIDAPGKRVDLGPLDPEACHDLYAWHAQRRTKAAPRSPRMQALFAGWPLGYVWAGQYDHQAGQFLETLLNALEDGGFVSPCASAPDPRSEASTTPSDSMILLLDQILEQAENPSFDIVSVVGALAMAPFEHDAIPWVLHWDPAGASEAVDVLAILGIFGQAGPDLKMEHALVQAYARSELPIEAEDFELLMTYYERQVGRLLQQPQRGIRLSSALARQLVELACACQRLERPDLLEGYANAVVQLLRSSGGYAVHQRQVCQLALSAARARSDREAEGRWLGDLGNAHLALGQTLEAVDAHQQALEFARERGDEHFESEHQSSLGLGLSSLNRLDEAIAAFEAAIAISRKVGNRHGEGVDHFNLGRALAEQGRFEEAKAQLERALEVLDGIKSPEADLVWQALVKLAPDEYEPMDEAPG